MRLPFLIFVLASPSRCIVPGKTSHQSDATQADLQDLAHALAEDAYGHMSVSSLIQIHAQHAKSWPRSKEGGGFFKDVNGDNDDREGEDSAHDGESSPEPQWEARAEDLSAPSSNSKLDFIESSPELQFESQAKDSSTPRSISKYDLWAIHDLLLLGKASPLLANTSAGKAKVEAAANNLAAMLPHIHPVPECRAAIRDAGSLEEKAAACWTCLGLSEHNFTNPYLPNKTQFQDAANTEVNFNADQNHKLGACRGSSWPRACSFWSSFHAMGVLADAQGTGDQLMKAISPIIAGGALYCGGCTLHWRYLNKHMLPTELHDVGDLLPY